MKNLKEMLCEATINESSVTELVKGLCDKFNIKNKKNVEVAVKELDKKFGLEENDITLDKFFEWVQPNWFRQEYSKKEISKMCIDGKNFILGVDCGYYGEHTWNAEDKFWEEL